MESSNNKILVCIPAYNEGKTIEKVIYDAKKFCTQVVVCDDGSSDNTSEVSSKAGAHVLKHSVNRGYGSAIRSLFEFAKEQNADVMITLDSDGQHDVKQISRIIEPILEKKADIVIGSRFLEQKDVDKVPKYRSFGIKTITRLTQAASSYNHITDAQSGFRGYGKKALSEIDLFEDGMSVSTEILLTANQKNLILMEVPITINYDVENSSKHNPLSHGLEILTSVIRFVSVRHPILFYGLPGLVFLIISVIYMNWALSIFSETRYISTNMIVVSVGSGVIGIMLVLTGIILYTMKELLKGKTK